jgi:predicted RecB family nuclease
MAVRVTASDLHTIYRPSECDLRVYLRQQGLTAVRPSPYEEVLYRLGIRHEKAHLAALGAITDLSAVPEIERARRTREALSASVPVVYQGLFIASANLDGTTCEIVGAPDFILRGTGGGHVIRDSKISRRINDDHHPEIILQMGLYGWLYEQTFGRPPVRLEVHAGDGSIVEVPYDGAGAAMAALERIAALKTRTTEPYAAVGWTKCLGCGFRDHCWPRAVARRDVALVSGVDQGLARVLYAGHGVSTMDDLLSRFDESALANVRVPWGLKTKRVGKRAGHILRMASALASGEESLIRRPDVPEHPNYVMFDLEGLPPHLDDLEKIYLWGLQVYGERPAPFAAATAGFGVDGDRLGWERFLGEAQRVFDEYGDVPFVHWHHYERGRLDLYVRRYGDRDGVAARVRRNLLDLLPITEDAVALPLPSYSLKVVEQYVGFKREQEEFGGQWAMAKYIEAVETEDETTRAEVMDQILAYNREDLAATWAVLQWLRSKRT